MLTLAHCASIKLCLCFTQCPSRTPPNHRMCINYPGNRKSGCEMRRILLSCGMWTCELPCFGYSSGFVDILMLQKTFGQYWRPAIQITAPKRLMTGTFWPAGGAEWKAGRTPQWLGFIFSGPWMCTKKKNPSNICISYVCSHTDHHSSPPPEPELLVELKHFNTSLKLWIR